MLFFIGERLQMSVVDVERMSTRQVQGWLAWFNQATKQAPAMPDDAVDVHELSKAEMRRMFAK